MPNLMFVIPSPFVLQSSSYFTELLDTVNSHLLEAYCASAPQAWAELRSATLEERSSLVRQCRARLR